LKGLGGESGAYVWQGCVPAGWLYSNKVPDLYTFDSFPAAHSDRRTEAHVGWGGVDMVVHDCSGHGVHTNTHKWALQGRQDSGCRHGNQGTRTAPFTATPQHAVAWLKHGSGWHTVENAAGECKRHMARHRARTCHVQPLSARTALVTASIVASHPILMAVVSS
jgi:hypothetical protein